MKRRGKALRTASGCWFSGASSAAKSAVGSPMAMATRNATSVAGKKK